MGKRTTKYIAAVEEQQTACKTQIDNYLKASAEDARLAPIGYALADKCTERFDQLMKLHKRDLKIVQPLMFTDPVYVKYDKMGEELTVKWNAERKKMRTARNELFNALHRMNAKLLEFETFVAKKEKSKNPFKSKKSLPAAKDFIAASRVFHQNTQKALNDFGGID